MTITRYLAAATLATCVLAAAPDPSLEAARTHESSHAIKQPSVTYSESLVEEILDPAPAPVPDEEAEHGPFVGIKVEPVKVVSGGRTSIEFYFSCYFGIEADGGNWDWTYDARLFDPSNNQIKQASNWANDKPGYSSNLGHNIIDPAEGTYRCTIDWWVETFQLPQRQATVTISYTCPGDIEKTKIRKEYNDFNVVENRRPSCDNLRTDYSSTHFSSGELNRNGYHSLFWIQTALTTGLDAIRNDYGSAITTSNAYRCPEKNRDAGSQFLTTSWHLAGRAADLVPVSPDT
jgi:hypothetical protein